MTPSEQAAQADPVSAAPAMQGPRGRAWAVPLEPLAAVAGAVVGTLLIEAAWAHPIWHSYMLSVCHLRPMPDMPEPALHLPGATHEVLLAALDPAEPRQRALEGSRPRPLVPFNFSAQIIERGDAAALERVWRAAQAVCDGRLSPDTDHRRAWTALFGDNMLAG